MQTLLQTSISSLLLGAMITINGVAIDPNKIINDAITVTNAANIHQIATVLEVYYMDHDKYPQVSTGKELIDTFEAEGYIQNRPADPSIFIYEATNNAQNYKLKLK